MSNSLNYRKIWLYLGYSLVFFIVYMSLHPNPPDTRAVFMGDKLLHGLTYIFLMIWFCQLYKPASYKFVGLCLLLLGVLIEIAQWGTGYRYFEFADVVANFFGILVGWMLVKRGFANLFKSIEGTILNFRLR